jgi:hypothetical protein
MPSGGAAIGPARQAALDLLDRTFRSKPLVFVIFAGMTGIGLADHWAASPGVAGGVGQAFGMAALASRRRWGSLELLLVGVAALEVWSVAEWVAERSAGAEAGDRGPVVTVWLERDGRRTVVALNEEGQPVELVGVRAREG